MFNKRLLSEFKEQMKDVYQMILFQWLMLWCAIFMAGLHSYVLSSLFEQRPVSIVVYVVMIVILLIMKMMFLKKKNQKGYLVSHQMKTILRDKIFQHVYKMKGNISQAMITQLTTEGVEQLEIYFSQYLPQFFYALLAPLTLFVITIFISWKVAIALLICVPLIPISIIVVQKIAKRLLAKYWNSYTGLAGSFLENLQGLMTLKLYQSDQRYQEKMDLEAEEFRKRTMRVLIMQLNSISVMDIVAYGGLGLGVILSLYEYQNQHITLFATLFIIMIAIEYFLPLRLLGSYFHIASNGNEAANKIFRLLDTPLEDEKALKMEPFESLTLQDLSFGYDDHIVLKNINMTINKGDFIVIVGDSGSGKSTLTSLIMNQYHQYTGHLLWNQSEIKDYEQDEIYHHVTRLKHDSYIFKGTVRDNLLFAYPQANDEQLYHVLSQVSLKETITKKGGLDYMIEEGGRNLSGGQIQRLALARALLHDSNVYIFDEATSNIDGQSEKLIMEVIQELAKTKTIIMITHRMAYSRYGHEIIVMKDGSIQERGNYQSLMDIQGDFYHLYKQQEKLERMLEHGK